MTSSCVYPVGTRVDGFIDVEVGIEALHLIRMVQHRLKGNDDDDDDVKLVA